MGLNLPLSDQTATPCPGQGYRARGRLNGAHLFLARSPHSLSLLTCKSREPQPTNWKLNKGAFRLKFIIEQIANKEPDANELI